MKSIAASVIPFNVDEMKRVMRLAVCGTGRRSHATTGAWHGLLRLELRKRDDFVNRIVYELTIAHGQEMLTPRRTGVCTSASGRSAGIGSPTSWSRTGDPDRAG
jgi:hypothetical protein